MAQTEALLRANGATRRASFILQSYQTTLVSTMDIIEEDLTCSVCYCLFSDPRILPCSHTFCKACLNSLHQESTNHGMWLPPIQIKCPNCRSMTGHLPRGVDALPTNMSLKAIIEKYQRDSVSRSPSCPEHGGQPLNIYCIRDRQMICGFCLTVGEHQGHCIDDLQLAFVKEKETPSSLLATLSEKRWAEVCELGEQLEKEKAHCEALLSQDREEVNHFFRTLDAVLARKRQAYLEALDKAGAEVSRAYEPLIHRVQELQQEQQDLVSLGTSVTQDSPLVFLEKVHLLRERVEEFITTPLPSLINLSISPRAAEFLLQHWSAVTIGSLEEAPVPKVSCCSRCGSAESGRHGTNRWAWDVRRDLQPYSPVLLLLVLAVMWLNQVEATSLGFSLLSPFSELVHCLNSEVISPVWDLVRSVYSVMEAALEMWSTQLSSLRVMAVQQLMALFKTH
ncbi:tripartite motif-containing protein 59 isoform X2 [Solea solea]|uniref:tripartite motif-containing protein 59 isoform X2 n=1 Tax=Solea solea TaxID=90069 RepID=UPI00272B3310|nr:tripartite motif-containing protein 59 isoform X2 [Solea solea]